MIARVNDEFLPQRVMTFAAMRGEAGFDKFAIADHLTLSVGQADEVIRRCRGWKWLKVIRLITDQRGNHRVYAIDSFAYRRWLERAGESDPRIKNVANAIKTFGHDEDFIPHSKGTPTTTPRGSAERVAVYRRRVELGQDIWHEEDAMTGVARNDHPQRHDMEAGLAALVPHRGSPL